MGWHETAIIRRGGVRLRSEGDRSLEVVCRIFLIIACSTDSNDLVRYLVEGGGETYCAHVEQVGRCLLHFRLPDLHEMHAFSDRAGASDVVIADDNKRKEIKTRFDIML